MKRLSIFCTSLMLILLVSACSGVASSSTSATSSSTSVVTPLTIDNAGLVPVFGNASTTTLIYVHNNSNLALNGISYSSQNNNDSSSSVANVISKLLTKLFAHMRVELLDPSSSAACATIPAQGSCPLTIHTPLGLGNASQGAVLISAHYLLNGQPQSFSNLVNYAKVSSESVAGAIFTSGVALNSFGNSRGWATVYLYGSGQGQIYNLGKLRIDKPAATISQGDISGQQLPSNFVQAVELAAPALNSEFIATVTANSSLAASSFVNFARIGVSPMINSAILTSSISPLINSSSVNPSGIIYVTNAGSESALLGSLSASLGISNLGGSCGGVLPSGQSCSINFSVSQLGGSGNISLPYSYAGSSLTPTLVSNVTWYNGSGGMLLQMNATPPALFFNASQTESSWITLTNLGGYNLTNLSLLPPVVLSGNATANLIGGSQDSCSGQTLLIGASCQFPLLLSSAQSGSGQINLSVQAGSVAGNYLRLLPLSYTAAPYAAALSITPNPLNLIITGNNQQTQSQIISISNNGAAPATLSETPGLLGPSFLYESGIYSCGGNLPSGGNCNASLVFGPVSTTAFESGLASYTLTYAGGQTPSGTLAIESISYSVVPSNQSLVISAISASNSASGNGESLGTPFIFSGANTGSKQLTLTMTNNGSDPVIVSGVQDSNSPISWLLNTSPSVSTCFNGAQIPLNSTCSLVYQNQLALAAAGVSGGIGSSYSENLLLPTIVLQDAINQAVLYQFVPALPSAFPGPLVYATSQQATLVNSVQQINPGMLSESVTVQHLLANASGYTNLTVTTQLENYFVSESVTAGCSATSSGGIMTQVCTLIPSGGAASGAVNYAVNSSLLESAPLTLDALFSLSAGSQIVAMTPLAESINLSVMP